MDNEVELTHYDPRVGSDSDTRVVVLASASDMTECENRADSRCWRADSMMIMSGKIWLESAAESATRRRARFLEPPST